MNIKRLIGIVLIAVYGLPVSGARTMHLHFIPTYGSDTLVLADSAYLSDDGTEITIETLRFYISDIRLLHNGETAWAEPGSYHLVDAAMPHTFQMVLEDQQNIAYDEISFNLGIDSSTSVSGAMGGDLDPTKGMYWTWQSGYINFKLEGRSPVCKTRNHEFQFHLGGYSYPDNCLQALSFKIPNADDIVLKLDIRSMLQHIDLTKLNQVMTPGPEAVSLSGIAAGSFSIEGH